MDTQRAREEFASALAHERSELQQLIRVHDGAHLLRWEDANQVTRAAARELWTCLEAARPQTAPAAPFSLSGH